MLLRKIAAVAALSLALVAPSVAQPTGGTGNAATATATVLGTTADTAYAGSGNATVDALLKGIYANTAGFSTTGLATSANQATAIADLAAILAKISADPATQTTLAAVLAKLSSDPATQTTLAAVLAKLPTNTAPMQATGGTVQLATGTSGGASRSSTILPNNTTAVVVKGSPGQVYGVECFNNSATIAYIKVYDATSATAGSGTPTSRYLCPASTSGAGFVVPYPNGDAYLTGIAYVVTTGIADNDTTAPAANTVIVNVRYK